MYVANNIEKLDQDIEKRKRSRRILKLIRSVKIKSLTLWNILHTCNIKC